MNNPLLYTDPSGQVCIAGFDVFPWGDKCTDQDRARAVAAFQWWGGLLSSTNYQGGYIYEILYNLAVVPELAQQVVTFMMNNVPSFKTWAENSAAQAFLNCDPDIQQFLVWAKNYAGSQYFKLGQASGRITLLLLSGGAIVGSIGGGTAVAVTTAGFGLAVSSVAASVAAYGITVATSVVVRELSDHLIMSAIGGNLGGGGSGGGDRPVNRSGQTYPEQDVPGYGEVPFPDGPINITDPNPMRAQFTQELRMQFRNWWYNKYHWYPSPNGYEIHHILPLSRGGTNDFDNLVPLRIGAEHQQFTTWWLTYP